MPPRAPVAGLLQVPGGSIVLGLVGIGIGITGVTFVVMGVKRSFRNKVDIPEHGIGRSVAGLGVIGFVAKGVALLILGVLLIVAAVTTDADVAGALDGALRALLALAYGPLLVGAVGIGLHRVRVFCLFRARRSRGSETHVRGIRRCQSPGPRRARGASLEPWQIKK